MGIESAATWSREHSTWDGREELFGTVPVRPIYSFWCVCLSIRMSWDCSMRMEDCASWDLTTEAHGRLDEGEEWIWYGVGVRGSLGTKGQQYPFLAGNIVIRIDTFDPSTFDLGIFFGFDFDLWARKVPELGFLIF
nr:hypothetical protein [Tanacetum cinerariifolium]